MLIMLISVSTLCVHVSVACIPKKQGRHYLPYKNYSVQAQKYFCLLSSTYYFNCIRQDFSVFMLILDTCKQTFTFENLCI